MLISELLAPEFAAEMEMTRSLLTKIPDDKLNWKPSAEVQTVGWNAGHLAEIAGWTPAILNLSELDMAPVGGEPYVSPVATDMKSLLKTFDENVAGTLAALQGVPDAVMAEPWSLKMAGQTLFTMRKGDCLRKWVFSHTAHHRGALSVTLRLAGVSFTSIYEE